MVFITQIKSPRKIKKHIKIQTDKIQQNNTRAFCTAQTLIHSPFIHSITTQTFVHQSQHITSLMHLLCITLHLKASHHASISQSSHCISTHHTMHHRMHHISKTYHTANYSDTQRSRCIKRWCMITIMHHNDDALQQRIAILMYYGTTSL